MTGKRTTKKKSPAKVGGKRCKKQHGGALMQSGRGILASILPGPLGAIAGMIGLGRKRKVHRQHGGLDPKEYARALISSLGPIVKKDLGI